LYNEHPNSSSMLKHILTNILSEILKRYRCFIS